MAAYMEWHDGFVVRQSDGAFIPPHPGNRDWQEYQNWLDGGGVPDPMDPPDPPAAAA